MKHLFLVLFLFKFYELPAQDSTYIKVHFWYGSKPARGFKNTESKYFGGLHGGHVTIQFGDTTIGFSPKKGARVFAKKSHSNGMHHIEQPLQFSFDSTDDRQSTIFIPVHKNDIPLLKKLAESYLETTPYDYALFGMRCASSAHEFLSVAGIFKERSKLFSVFYNFYPKKLRKRLYDIAFENGYKIIYQDGRKERKWEGDKKRHRERLNSIFIENKNTN